MLRNKKTGEAIEKRVSTLYKSSAFIEKGVPQNLVFSEIYNNTAEAIDNELVKLTVKKGINKVKLSASIAISSNIVNGFFYSIINCYNKNGIAKAIPQPKTVYSNYNIDSQYNALCLNTSVLEVEEGDYFALRIFNNTDKNITLNNSNETYFSLEEI